MSFIEVEELVKDYKVNQNSKGLKYLFKNDFKVKRSVDHVSFTIEKGEMIGFIGPNGAGKSTTVKMLTGILNPTEGMITIDGLDPFKNRKKYTKNIGVVFGQKTQLWWDLPIIDTFDLLKSIYRVPNEIYKKNMEIFYDILDLGEFDKQSVRQLSLGQRMRADIAAAFLHDPEILFLDEPTIGLDVIAKDKIINFIKYINKVKNTTMIFTSHDLKDIEKVCEKIIIIDHGKKIYDDSIYNMKKMQGGYKCIEIELHNNQPILIPNTKVMDIGLNRKRVIITDNTVNINDVIVKLIKEYKVDNIILKDSDIEEIIKDIYVNGVKEGVYECKPM